MANRIKEAILEQKKNRERILELPYIRRTRTPELEKMLQNDLIKIILGPRRCGKSYFAMHVFKPNESAYINFDDERLKNIKNYDEIIQELIAAYGDTRFLFFDEIQNLPDWELFVNRLHQQGYQILLTGSNSKLLSKELATHLTGRHQSLELMPFDFQEFLTAKNFTVDPLNTALAQQKGLMLNLLQLFMKNGGFPEVVLKDLEPETYLASLLESLVFRDVITRYQVRFPTKLYDLELYFINNIASEFSYRKLSNILQFKSLATLTKYVGYLEEA